MDRRTLVLFAAVGTVAGCASRNSALQAVSLGRIALLSIKELPPAGDGGAFNAALLNASRPAKSVIPPPPITPTMLGIGIGMALRTSTDAAKAASRANISRALAPVGLNPKQQLALALERSFSKRGLPVSTLDDDAASESVRNDWAFGKLPPGTDAFLDVQIVDAGYFPAKEAGGYSPMVYVYAELVSSAGKGVRIGKYSYDADHRSADGDIRFFTTPSALNVRSLDQITDRRDSIRDSITATIGSIAEQIAVDLERAINKQPPL